MRYFLVAGAVSLLMGCATTQVVEVARNDQSAINTINAMAANERATVQLRSSQVSVETRESLLISEDSVTYVLRRSDFTATTPLADIRQIGFGSTGSGLGRGALYGGLIGGVGFGLIALASNDECSSDDWCLFDISDSEAFAAGFLVGGLGGALIGGIVGAFSGSPGVIYRFRSETPEQLSVVIGLGPNMTQDGRGR